MSREGGGGKVEDPQYEDRKRKSSLRGEDREDPQGNYSRSYGSGKKAKKRKNESSSKHHKKKHKKKRQKKKDSKKSKERTVSGVPYMYATSV